MKNMSMQAFITEFNIFARQLIKKYKIHTDKDKCIPRFHSVDKPDTNAKVNDEILSFISTFYENMDNIHTNYNREMSEDVKLEREIKSLMIDYMEEYLEDNKFFTIKDGKYIINRDKIEYTFSYDEKDNKQTNIADIMTAKRDNENNYLTLIITKDGKTYKSPTSHASLFIWLNMLGIDTNKALRVEWTGPQENFYISSFVNYDYNNSKNNERRMEITNEQAESLMTLINTIDGYYPKYAMMHPENNALLSYLEKSENLGLSPWNYDASIADANLTKLSKFTNERTDFNKTKFLKNLHTTAREY